MSGRTVGTHKFWFGTMVKGPREKHPRCSCSWHGEAQTDLTRALLVWLDHVEWDTKPGVSLFAEVWIPDEAFTGEEDES